MALFFPAQASTFSATFQDVKEQGANLVGKILNKVRSWQELVQDPKGYDSLMKVCPLTMQQQQPVQLLLERRCTADLLHVPVCCCGTDAQVLLQLRLDQTADCSCIKLAVFVLPHVYPCLRLMGD